MNGELAGIAPNVIQFHNVLGQDYFIPFDNTQFHDYRFERTPGIGFQFFVDNNLLFSSALSPFNNEPNNLFLGDASQGAVAQADVTRFEFTQTNTPRYSVCLLYDPTKAVRSGATVPIKLQLCDGNGNDLSSSSITLYATSITQVSSSISGPVQDSGNANPDFNFRFDSTLGSTGGYIFNLSTKGAATGTYNLNFTVTGDTFVYPAPFQVK